MGWLQLEYRRIRVHYQLKPVAPLLFDRRRLPQKWRWIFSILTGLSTINWNRTCITACPNHQIRRYYLLAKQNPEPFGIYCLSREGGRAMKTQQEAYSSVSWWYGLATRNANDVFWKSMFMTYRNNCFGGIDKPDVCLCYPLAIFQLEDIIRKQDVTVRRYAYHLSASSDLSKVGKIVQGCKPISEQETGKQLLLETAAYAESKRHYVVERFYCAISEKNILKIICGNCDNCLNWKQVEAQDLLVQWLKQLQSLKKF